MTNYFINFSTTPEKMKRFLKLLIKVTVFHSRKPEFRFNTGSCHAHGVSEIYDGENLWQWSWLEIRLNTFRRSTIPQKQIIIIIIIIITKVLNRTTRKRLLMYFDARVFNVEGSQQINLVVLTHFSRMFYL